MYHDVNLNIHYSAPESIVNKLTAVFSTMPYWCPCKDEPRWIGPNIELVISFEPSGLQFYGTMPEEIWDGWYKELKSKLSQVLGYEVGEPENGFEFMYWYDNG